MINTINEYDFIEAFKSHGREESYSYEGKIALFNYFEEMEESCETKIELDVIAICCEFTEYEDLNEIKETYNDIETIEDLYDYTQVIEFDGGIIIADF